MNKIKLPNQAVGPFPGMIVGAMVDEKPTYTTVGAGGCACLEGKFNLHYQMRHIILKSQNKKFIGRFEQRYPTVYQLTSFCVIGASGLAVMLLTYYLFIWMGLHVQIANLAGYFMSTVYSYLLDFVFVFGNRDAIQKGSALKFFILYFVLYFYSAFLIHLVVDVLYISKLIAPVINVMLLTPPSFLCSKYWVFRKEK